MPKSKKSVEGVRSSVSGELLTYANGEPIPAEHYSDYTQAEADMVDAMTEEEVYASSVRAGLPRDPRIEAELDMVRVEQLINIDA